MNQWVRDEHAVVEIDRGSRVRDGEDCRNATDRGETDGGQQTSPECGRAQGEEVGAQREDRRYGDDHLGHGELQQV